MQSKVTGKDLNCEGRLFGLDENPVYDYIKHFRVALDEKKRQRLNCRGASIEKLQQTLLECQQPSPSLILHEPNTTVAVTITDCIFDEEPCSLQTPLPALSSAEVGHIPKNHSLELFLTPPTPRANSRKSVSPDSAIFSSNIRTSCTDLLLAKSEDTLYVCANASPRDTLLLCTSAVSPLKPSRYHSTFGYDADDEAKVQRLRGCFSRRMKNRQRSRLKRQSIEALPQALNAVATCHIGKSGGRIGVGRQQWKEYHKETDQEGKIRIIRILAVTFVSFAAAVVVDHMDP